MRYCDALTFFEEELEGLSFGPENQDSPRRKAVNTAVKALRHACPKKAVIQEVVIEIDDNWAPKIPLPTCSECASEIRFTDNYCRNCGQKISW